MSAVIDPNVILVRRDTDAVALAGGLFTRVQRGESPTLRAIGAGAVNQMVKACAIASKMASERGRALCLHAGFETVELPDKYTDTTVERSAVVLKAELL